MYKCKLQELCQQRTWLLPKYSSVKDGPDHLPRFTATVNVNGQVFDTPASCRSSKEAQNSAAKIAFDHFSASPPPPASAVVDVAVNPSDAEAVFEPPVFSVNTLPRFTATVNVNGEVFDMPASCRSSKEAQNSAAKIAFDHFSASPPPPASAAVDAAVNSSDAEAVPEPPVFSVNPSALIPAANKSSSDSDDVRVSVAPPITVDLPAGAAAEFPALDLMPPPAPAAPEFPAVGPIVQCGRSISVAPAVAADSQAEMPAVDPVAHHGFYKNLLQHFAQKRGLLVPSYETTGSGLPHDRVFVSTVEVGEHTFRGDEAKTKKQAEMLAAKVAYYTLAKGCLDAKSQFSSMDVCPVADNVVQNIQPPTIAIKHEDTRDEGDNVRTKRAKPSAKSMKVDETPSPSAFPSVIPNVTQVDNSFTVLADRVVEPSVGAEPLL